MEQIIEINDDRIKILALSHEGVWLPFMEIEIIEKFFNIYRAPLLLKIECLGQSSQLNIQE